MKKRTLALMLSAALCVGLLAGCGSGNNDPVNTPAAGGSETPSQESTAGPQPVVTALCLGTPMRRQLSYAFRCGLPG